MPLTPSQDTPPDACAEIGEKVRTGEYFREARSMYDVMVHDLMAERYFYLFITLAALAIFGMALVAVKALYPLNTPVPFIYSTNDIVEDLPRMRSLAAYDGESPSDALLRFMVEHYVTVREEYDIDSFDRDVSGVKSESSDEVFNAFQQAIDPRNPDSPITLYQRHSKRKIAIQSVTARNGGMEVIFDASVEGQGEIKKSRWRANIAFQYNGVALDQKTQKVNPVSFVVTQYHATRLQDMK